LKKDLIVIKFGTASITQSTGEPDTQILADIARQVATLSQTYRIVLVSSGAVGAGKKYIKNYEGTINQKKAAAAIGNPLLLKLYDEAFEPYGIRVAQSLLERQHFSNRTQFLQLKATYEELWENNIIPIANENDVVSNRELKFSDNDELATLIAAGFGAHKLLLCTSSGGLLDNNNMLVSSVSEVNDAVMSLVKKSKSALGSGGMSSKLTFTKLATKMGISVTIFGLKVADGILKSLENNAGTTFDAQKIEIDARKRWIASAGLSVAKVLIDEGASNAVLSRKSLLSIGVKSIQGDFQKGELIEIINQQEDILGMGIAKFSRVEVEAANESLVLIHADDLVLL
jgi:glutamate 5-kinase